ncbi:MAG: oligopeptide/dipeptide ABC transporter ATP-binding protein [Pseudomonadota bacterium]
MKVEPLSSDAASDGCPDGASQPRDTFMALEGVTKDYPVGKGRTLRAVDRVSLSVGRGETLGIVGESGCGKSTLGRLIVNLEPPSAGHIAIDGSTLSGLRGRKLTAMRKRVQMIFQDPVASLNPRMLISDSIAEPLRNDGTLGRAAIAKEVTRIAGICGLSDHHLQRYPHELSGGQCQRVGIARAIALRPDVIVADEPVSALDVSIQAQILNLIVRLQREFGLTLIFISHDMAVVRHVADRVAVMYLGRVVELSDAAEIFARPSHPYAAALFSSVPRPRPDRRRHRANVEGELPSPIDPPSGCHFRPRCRFATDICAAEKPQLRAVATGRTVACHHADAVRTATEL